ncbi:MAG: hypothetical protein M4579_003464 [Chaenotheca gracillima]|nr:MAG: hypothetical protein M4579_003464 [Chaenotheca gracillima]
MTTNLPSGFVTTTDSIAPEIKSFDHVEVEDIARLWKAYSSNRNLLPNDAGRRLENIFWRIWGCRRIHETISGAELARLFMIISEDRGIIRTTPVQSPRARHRRPEFPAIISSPHHEAAAQSRCPATPIPSLDTPKAHPLPSTSSPERLRSGPLPPILKNTSQPQPSSYSQPTLSMRRTGSNESGSSAERKISFVAPRPPTPPHSHRNQPAAPLGENGKDGGNNHTKRKKKTTTFAAGSGVSRRRPFVMRRKSSQSSGGTSSSAKSAGSIKFAPDETTETLEDDDLKASMAPKEAKSRMRTSSQGVSQGTPQSILKQSKPADDVQSTVAVLTPEDKEEELRPLPPPARSKSWVVDRDARAQFVADRRSHTDLAAIGRNHPLRSRQKTGPTLAATSEAAVGKVDLGNPSFAPGMFLHGSKGKQAQPLQHPVGPSFFDRTEPLKQEGPSAATTAATSSAPRENPEPLQRTKSQLTLLLERDRMQQNRTVSSSASGHTDAGGRKNRTSSS